MTIRLGLGILFCTAISWGQQYLTSTVAGGAPLPLSIAATSVPLHLVGGLTADSSGNVYFTSSNCVFRLDLNGGLTRIAGNSRAGYSGDGGPALAAQLSSPAGIAVDASGNLFIADSGNNRVRRISSTGLMTTIAGSGQIGTPVSGTAAVTATFGFLSGIAVDKAGRVLIADAGNNMVLSVSPNGIITIIAGTGTNGYTGDGGPAVVARLSDPAGLALDGTGNIFISDTANSCVRRVASDGTITTFAGTGFPGFSGDGGPAAVAQFIRPEGVAFDRSGNLLIADTGNNRIRKVSTDGVVTTLAGNGTSALTGDGGPAIAAGLPSGGNIAVDSFGNIVVDSITRTLIGAGLPVWVERSGDFSVNITGSPIGFYLLRPLATGVSVLRRIWAGGTITTVAGNNSTGLYGIGGPAVNAQFGSAQGVAVDGSGNLFIADPVDDEVLKVSTTGTVTVVAGTGVFGFSGDGGLATSAQLDNPVSVAADGSGNLFIADQDNGRIRKVSPTGIITTVAGNGNAGYAGDGGQAKSAEIARPAHVSVDGSGNLFILDTVNDVVRKVATSGVITTVAGNGSSGYSGDGGTAVKAQLNNPTGLAVDADGNIFIADTYNCAVRKVTAAGTITTFAGGSCIQYVSVPGVGQPTGVAVDKNGNLFVIDVGYILRVSSAGLSPTIVAWAGAQYSRFATDIAVDGTGKVFLTNAFDSDVQKLTPPSQAVVISAVADAASELATPISPGKIVVIYGSGMGPDIGVLAKPSGGVFGTMLAGTTVSFNGIPAPVYYASDTQVEAIVPYAISGSTAFVTVAYQSGISAGFSAPVALTSPGIFTYNATGAGQAAAINVADGTLNTAVNPVKPGDFISLYATGEGQTSPAGVDGKVWPVAVLPLPPPTPLQKVTATVGGVPAFVNYAGGVPLSVAGLLQVNVQIPKGVTAGGYVPVTLTVGNTSTVDGAIWIAVSN